MCYNNLRVIKKHASLFFISMQRYFAYGEYTLALRLTSELVDLRAGYAKRIQ